MTKTIATQLNDSTEGKGFLRGKFGENPLFKCTWYAPNAKKSMVRLAGCQVDETPDTAQANKGESKPSAPITSRIAIVIFFNRSRPSRVPKRSP